MGGLAFVVTDERTFESSVLPKHYKHAQMNSFLRQLNMYGFRRVDGVELTWQHGAFRRDRPQWLARVVRKPTELKANKKSSVDTVAAAPSESVTESGAEDVDYQALQLKIDALLRQQRADARRMTELLEANTALQETLDQSLEQQKSLVSLMLANQNLVVATDGNVTDQMQCTDAPTPELKPDGDASHADFMCMSLKRDWSPSASATASPRTFSPPLRRRKLEEESTLPASFPPNSSMLQLTDEQTLAMQIALWGGLSAATHAAATHAMLSAWAVARCQQAAASPSHQQFVSMVD